MSLHMHSRLPEPEILKQEMPMSAHAKAVKASRDQEISDVFSGKSDKFVLIIGPCSADSEQPVLEYCHRLADINEKSKTAF